MGRITHLANIPVKAELSQAAAFIDTLAGVNWVTDLEGLILAIGEANWTQFARSAHGQHLVPDRLIGTSLFDQIQGEGVKIFYRDLHARLVSSKSESIEFNYRCDAPDIERHMSMRITGIRDDGEIVGLVYQSGVTAQRPRPAIRIFEQVGSHTGPFLKICSGCHDVVWPPDMTGPQREWIDLPEYYRRGGPEEVMLDHDICPDCVAMVQTVSLTEIADGAALVPVCCYCWKIAWPVDADPEDRTWISPAEYYHRGGGSQVPITYGICGECRNQHAPVRVP